MGIPKINDLFDLKEFKHSKIFDGLEYPWDVLKPHLKSEYIRKVFNPNCMAISRDGGLVTKTTVIWENEVFKEGFEIKRGSAAKGELLVTKRGEILKGASVIFAGAFVVGNEIEIGEGCLIEEGAYVIGPTILGDQTEVRQGGYVRGEVITGKNCVVGHTTEIKSSIMINDSKAPHFAYIGDSVIGNRVNLGAGTKVSNPVNISQAPVIDISKVCTEVGFVNSTGYFPFSSP